MPNMDPKKCPMPVQDPEVRNKNFSEVAFRIVHWIIYRVSKHLHKPCLYQLVQFGKLLLTERNQLL